MNFRQRPVSGLKSFALVLLTVVCVQGWGMSIQASIPEDRFVEVMAQAPARNNNYAQARNQAIHHAFSSALETRLKEILGEAKFEINQKQLTEILNQPERFVKSYRFIEAWDDFDEKVSVVKLEVMLYLDALNKTLARLGILGSIENAKNVIILIRESSFTSREEEPFWEKVSISETALTQNFVQKGVKVVPRDPVQEKIPEEMVLSAINGDLNNTVKIGLTAGADVVILGNAVSVRLEDAGSEGEAHIQANMSVRMVSVLQGTVIAAKSDFANTQNPDPLAGELEAFEEVSRKLSGFLVPALKRYWQAKPAPVQPVQEKPELPESPFPMGDL